MKLLRLVFFKPNKDIIFPKSSGIESNRKETLVKMFISRLHHQPILNSDRYIGWVVKTYLN